MHYPGVPYFVVVSFSFYVVFYLYATTLVCCCCCYFVCYYHHFHVHVAATPFPFLVFLPQYFFMNGLLIFVGRSGVCVRVCALFFSLVTLFGGILCPAQPPHTRANKTNVEHQTCCVYQPPTWLSSPFIYRRVLSSTFNSNTVETPPETCSRLQVLVFVCFFLQPTLYILFFFVSVSLSCVVVCCFLILRVTASETYAALQVQ